ncbi:hypothetical protein BU26DRAFT_449917 [Trematosphaeria pertusa]|uniref:Heterokaryon incompatibility domain-containing protein n=1 Tax=Trematosphaeria pertusa TaxID=390896 RepID=A0A6A6IVN9_9PLEO|nr:uncharacterized protein BU26DRAFT_449917 [Trematosphaeria pertusa]KAF2253263.1 hypothetical protein BU26DRAFT_449917 [Trematosphaeria pertusa]
MPASVVYIDRSNPGPSRELEFPIFNLHDLAAHHYLDNSVGPWSASRSAEYHQKVRGAEWLRATRLGKDVTFPSRLLSPSGESFRTGSLRPEYVVISYTWGRWMKKKRYRDTPIQGGHWKAPWNKRFTRAELDSAIQTIANGSHAWVDVFCIPQMDNDPEMANEISKQGEIFRSASRAAVWLGTGGEEVLREVCSWVPDTQTLIVPDTLALADKHMNSPEPRLPEKIAETVRRIKLISEFTEHVPWCNSLWTLQEAALRPEAQFFDKVGKPILHDTSKNPITIRHLINTMRNIAERLDDLLDEDGSMGYNIFEQPYMFGFSEEERQLVFRAIETVKTVSLHWLTTMNAGEVLLASTSRKPSRLHDRVYGIMGAIGAPIPVKYDEDADKVMNQFLVHLHNTLPIEMQAFHREYRHQYAGQGWRMDHLARKLTLLRQESPPPRPVFTGISPDGELVINELDLLSPSSFAELNSRVLGRNFLAGLDRRAFELVNDGVVYTKSYTLDYIIGSINFALILQDLFSKTNLGLVFLGFITGLEHVAWRYAYLLVASKCGEGAATAPQGQRFRRLGILIFREELRAGSPTKGEFFII